MTKNEGELRASQRKALALLTDEWQSPFQLKVPKGTLYALVTWRKAQVNAEGNFRLFRETIIQRKGQ
jgi:hypothetical protein